MKAKIVKNIVVRMELDGEDYEALYRVLGKHSIVSHAEMGADEDDIRRVNVLWDTMHNGKEG